MDGFYVIEDHLGLRGVRLELPCPDRCGSEEERGTAVAYLHGKDTDHRSIASCSVTAAVCDLCGSETAEDKLDVKDVLAAVNDAGYEPHTDWPSALAALGADRDVDECDECGCDLWNGDHAEWCTAV